MSPRSRTSSTGIMLAALGVAGFGLCASEAHAQASGCGDLQTHLLQRKQIGARLSAGGKKQLDAKVACKGFNDLVQNGATLIKWAEANKDWCQIPDSFIDSVKADHGKASGIRTKACGIAAKQAQMEKQAKNGAAPGASGLLGGNGLSGSRSLPAGAL